MRSASRSSTTRSRRSDSPTSPSENHRVLLGEPWPRPWAPPIKRSAYFKPSISSDKVAATASRRSSLSEASQGEQVTQLWGFLDGGTIPGAADAEAQPAIIVELNHTLGVDPDRVAVDRTLARGLDYYTGPVFETVLNGYSGSISGGGRHDGLVRLFSGKGDVPAVGVSLGIERIFFMLMEEMGLMPDTLTTTQVWATVFRGHPCRDTGGGCSLAKGGSSNQVSTRVGKLGKHQGRYEPGRTLRAPLRSR